MAKSIILYPTNDISFSHSASSGSSGYVLIYDVTSDDGTSYIYHNLTTSDSNITSTFKCDNTNITGKIYITGISSLIRSSYTANTANINSPVSRTSVSIHGGNFVNGSDNTVTGSYTTFTDTYQNVSGLNTIYQSIDDANIVIGVYTSGSYTSTTDKEGSSATINVTQANVTIEYEDVFDCYANSISGSGIKSVNVSNNEVVDGNTTTFTAVLEDNFKFDGWYSDAEGTNKVSSDITYVATITQNTTLYAKGTLFYNVSVYGDENLKVSSSSNIAKGGTPITVTGTPTSDRYEFKGWFSNENRTTLVSTDNPYTFILTKDTVLYGASSLSETMYVKVNGVWSPCSKVYKKIDGRWVEQLVLSGLFDSSKNYKIIKV
jgi:hypothetical protein